MLSAFPYALTTVGVAAVEAALITATGEGRAQRRPAGDGSLWAPARDQGLA